jgi:lipopolysaccharide transport system permease protein
MTINAASSAQSSHDSTQSHLPGGEGLEHWDISIEPNESLFTLPLREVWRFRDLMYLMVRRDIVSFYKQTILGPLWYVVQPVLTTLIYMLVFSHIAGLSTDSLPQFLFYLCGITFWNYFSECLSKTATVFRDNAGLFGKVYFPRIIMPLSIVTSSLFRFAIQFSLFLLVACYYYRLGDVHVMPSVLLFPVLVATMALLGLGLGMLFSAMTTKYRDLVFLLQFGIQLLMYLTPVIYPFSQAPASLQSLLAWNPLVPIFETARHGFLGAGTYSLQGLLYSTAFACVFFVIAAFVFNRVERTFMDSV